MSDPKILSAVTSKSENSIISSFIFYWLPLFLYAGLIFYLSSRPLSSVKLDLGMDKLAHLLEYGVLSLIMVRAFRNSSWPWLLRHAVVAAIVISIFYGISDEIHQSFVPNRHADVWDVVFDGLGATLAQLPFLFKSSC